MNLGIGHESWIAEDVGQSQPESLINPRGFFFVCITQQPVSRPAHVRGSSRFSVVSIYQHMRFQSIAFRLNHNPHIAAAHFLRRDKH